MQLNITIKKLDDGSYFIQYNHGLLSKTGKSSSKTKEELAESMKSLILKEA
jgi:hypothetical protein